MERTGTVLDVPDMREGDNVDFKPIPINDFGKEKGTQIQRIFELYSHVDTILDEVNKILGGFGVESIRHEGAWIDGYFLDIIALYVNLGDTYDTTLVYDTTESEWLVTSWGSFYEGWMQENDEYDDYHAMV